MAAILVKKNVTQALGVLFQALVHLAVKAMYLGEGNSNPCSYFIEQAMEIGGAEGWVKKVVYKSGGEYRLNGAGLKMYITFSHTGTQALVTLGGDQVDLYPEFVVAGREAIVRLKLDHDSYFKEG